MGTRAIIKFGHKDDNVLVTTAAIYHHWDGYPESDAGILAKLDHFLHCVEFQCKSFGKSGTRFDDPSYLAAKFVVYCSEKYQHKTDFGDGKHIAVGPLDFSSIGIVPDGKDFGQEYEYFLDCATHDARPEVYWKSKNDKQGWRQGLPVDVEVDE